MPPCQHFPFRKYFRKAVSPCLAAGLLLAGGGVFCGRFAGNTSEFGISAAFAANDDEGHHARHSAGADDSKTEAGPRNGHDSHGDHVGRGGHDVRSGAAGGSHAAKGDVKPHRGDSLPLSQRTSLSYDANRNMLKVHVAVGEHHDLHTRPHVQPALHARPEPAAMALIAHTVDPQAKTATDTYFRGMITDKERQTFQALDRSITPVASRYQSSMFGEREASTTIMAKTKLPIGGLSFSPNEVLAVGADRASIERAEALGFKADPILTSESSDHTIIRFTVPPGLDAVRGQDLLSRELPGQRFELNRVYRLYRASSREEPVTLDKSLPATAPATAQTCDANRCFAREVIGWRETLSSCARGLKVGVIDTDIDEGHPAFAGRRIHRFDFAPDGRLPGPNWHGTAVLSLLAGGILTNTPGLIPDAEFFTANIFYSDERGEMAADTISLLKALDWMKAYDVKIINMSFAGPRDALVGEAIERMSESGVIFVAAAGNEGPTAEPAYPAAYPQVIAVTAVTKDLRNYRYANRGDHIDISAPGVDIWTAAPGGHAGYHTGTSFAAPHVTAVLAVEPPETLRQRKEDLLDNLAVMDLGQEGRDPIYGRGLLLAPTECTPPEETSETVASAE